jgi:uncharacterized RDD family membrane protein YckC
MFCSACGQQMQPGTRFCINCGAAATAGVSAPWTGTAAPAPTGVHTPEGFRTFADFGPRLGAHVIDLLIQMVPAIALFVALIIIGLAAIDWDGTSTTDEQAAWAFVWVLLFGGLTAFVWTVGYRWWGNATGRPFGKRLAGIRVVSEATGLPPGVGSGFVRLIVEFALGIFSPLNLINYFWPLWDTKKQTIHDKAAGTVVVRDAVSSPSGWNDDPEALGPSPWAG